MTIQPWPLVCPSTMDEGAKPCQRVLSDGSGALEGVGVVVCEVAQVTGTSPRSVREFADDYSDAFQSA